MPPAVDNLIPENDLVRFVELNDELDTERILSNQCSLSQNIADLGQAMLIGKVVDILKKLIFGNTAQRIFDSANFQRPVRPGQCANLLSGDILGHSSDTLAPVLVIQNHGALALYHLVRHGELTAAQVRTSGTLQSALKCQRGGEIRAFWIRLGLAEDLSHHRLGIITRQLWAGQRCG